MTISAKIILDSINDAGDRLTTMELRFPRFILSQFNTHRVFSRNASSSRAIPVEKLIQNIKDDTAIPIHWGKNIPGMQANEECDEPVEVYDDGYHIIKTTKEKAWLKARDRAINTAMAFSKAGYHKQIVNRLIEPFSHINVLVSSTDYDNFFTLRDHRDAQPEIQMLAKAMKEAMKNSTTQKTPIGGWHLPYTDDLDSSIALEDKKKISVARCAGVSYKTVDGKLMTIERALEIFNKLYVAEPFHASPFEHIAYASEAGEPPSDLNGNFRGWKQYRKILEQYGK